MQYDFTNLGICCTTQEKAATLFAEEIEIRTGIRPSQQTSPCAPCVVFKTDTAISNKDTYRITIEDDILTVFASGIRGHIFGFSLFLRKAVFKDGHITLLYDISGSYAPDKKVRGHQLGYRTTPNSYDAWTYEQYNRYYRDLMFFGCNIVEHIPYENGHSKRNALMQYDEEEFLITASAMADKLDLDVSLWYPNSEDSMEEALLNRERVFKSMPRLNVVFPPGGDPGELEPDELFTRCEAFRKLLKKYHPNAQLWPSAQAPHGMPLWGEAFIDETKTAAKRIDGVVTGPNRAFPLDELRRRLPEEYPIRLYPDITHNVRCEYPVHFDRDDWHYALCSALSRECINPRPVEYRAIHELTRRYVVGSVSYSEGISDDVNKFVWSDMDFFPHVSLHDTLTDYARLFFIGADYELVADAILALEKNWEGDPTENPFIETTLQMWESIGRDNPAFCENWRYNELLFRACCDALVRRRMLFENKLIVTAKAYIANGKLEEAAAVLASPASKEYKLLREKIEDLAATLFVQIGHQLDVARYGANSWERGATLETLDLPVTDRLWFQKKLAFAQTMNTDEATSFMKRIVERNCVEADEFYFSFALDGFIPLGVRQEPDFYMNFQGDRPQVNDGSLPVCMFKLYDHFSLHAKLGGFTEKCDYLLQLTLKNDSNTIAKHFFIKANDTVIYDGKPFGGANNTVFEQEMLPEGYVAVCYQLPRSCFINGCLDLLITEPLLGFQCSEFRIVKYKNYTKQFSDFC